MKSYGDQSSLTVKVRFHELNFKIPFNKSIKGVQPSFCVWNGSALMHTYPLWPNNYWMYAVSTVGIWYLAAFTIVMI